MYTSSCRKGVWGGTSLFSFEEFWMFSIYWQCCGCCYCHAKLTILCLLFSFSICKAMMSAVGGEKSFTFLNGPSVTELISTSTLDNIPQERPLLVYLRGWLQLKPPAVIVNTDRFCLASIVNINNLFFFFKSVWIKC